MKKKMVGLFLLSCLSAFGGTTWLSDPIADYLREDNPNAYLDNTTRRDPYYSDFGLFRLDLDLNEDRRAEVLVSSTKDRDGRQGNLWLVYEPSGDGYTQVGEMTFSANGFYLGQVDEINRYGLVTFNPAGGGEGTLSVYVFDGAAVREIQLASMSRDSQTGELREQAIVDKYVQRATKGDQLVRSIDATTLANQYGIKIDVRTNRQAAQDLVAAPQAQGPSSTLSSPMVSSSDPSRSFTPQPDKTAPFLAPVLKAETSGSIPWTLIAVIAGVVLAGAIVVIKRK